MAAIATFATTIGCSSSGGVTPKPATAPAVVRPSIADPYSCPTSGPVPQPALAQAGGFVPLREPGPVQERAPLSVDRRYFTNDPYFKGYPPSRAPYFETPNVGGMWNAHAIGLDFAWEYSQPNNGSGVYQPLALGSSSVKIAIVDTGADLRHPELAGKVVYARCFLTNGNGIQTTSNYVNDYNGHGTNLAGIVGAAINNAVGFAGAGGKTSLMIYRVFPTPDDRCLNGGRRDPRCNALPGDIAAAINDAVGNGARAIVLGFGGGRCPGPKVEKSAVENAIAHNVVVIAPAGNEGASHLVAPACDPGVIAAGATGLADGRRNGTNDDRRGEYVAGYSNYDSLTGTWGLLAPGGDPYCPNRSGCNDRDYLHWIYGISTSTPYSPRYAALCTHDPGFPNGPNDCRILIAGTSMAAAQIGGAVALILAVNPGAYATPSAMFQLLCSTATQVRGKHQGCGRLDAYRAMAIAVHDQNPP